jgi:hypothetical protein
MHLNTDELVDIAEGMRSEASAPHLAGCEPCRAQLRELRAMMAAAKDVDVPEPSPLFWDHLSARIGAAVAQDEREPRRSSRWFPASVGGWLPVAVVALAAVLLAVTVSLRAPAPVAPPPSMVAVTPTVAPTDLLADPATEGDASLTLVASLADGLDFDGEREAGLTPRGSAEHAITHMSPGELRELGRLLKEEME